MPAEIEFREELPKTLIGKLSKKELVAEEKDQAAIAAQDATMPPLIDPDWKRVDLKRVAISWNRCLGRA